MAKLAFTEIPKVLLDERETVRSGASYTIDTLTELQAEVPQAQIFLIMGEDQFKTLATWHRWQDIAQIATICVAARAVYTKDNAKIECKNTMQTACKIHTLSMNSMLTSATEIRRRVGEGLATDGLVKPAVARYIARHHLYLSKI